MGIDQFKRLASELGVLYTLTIHRISLFYTNKNVM